MSARRDHYEVLGVARDATPADIKAAYRRLALRHHPDRNPGDAQAEESFKSVTHAYAVLSDPEQRSRYDRYGDVDTPGAGPFGGEAAVASAAEFFDSLFGDLFGLARRRARQGRDLRYTLELDFEEAVLGCEKTISFARAEDCSTCVGTGAQGGAAGLQRCERCNGEGTVRRRGGFLAPRRECMACGGRGEVPRVPCPACEGSGIVERERQYRVVVSPGTSDGNTQRVAGEGSPGRRGGVAGDLHVVIRVRPHPTYSRSGDVLVCELPVSPTEATLGADVEVPVLDSVVSMRLPAGTQSGAVLRLRGKGFPKAPGLPRGDAHVRIVIETPAQVSEPTRDVLLQLESSLDNSALPRRAALRELTARLAGRTE